MLQELTVGRIRRFNMQSVIWDCVEAREVPSVISMQKVSSALSIHIEIISKLHYVSAQLAARAVFRPVFFSGQIARGILTTNPL
jgi:hypothetical protein